MKIILAGLVIGVVWILVMVSHGIRYSRKRKLPPYNH